MNRDEYLHLLAERSAIVGLLRNIPEEDVLDRNSFLWRLEEVNQSIIEGGVSAYPPASARLTFRGRPVVASHGIYAEFGMTATKAFTDAVSARAAALSSPLASMGPIPNRQQNQLLITNTVLGSFGFELEENTEGKLFIEDESPVALALEQTQDLLQGTLGTDDDLADAATGTDPRAVAAIRTFLETLFNNEAVCALEVGKKKVRFQDVGQVRRSWERLGQDNFHEEQRSFEGEFQGVLPKRRTFEFQVRESKEVITGKIGTMITNPDDLNHHLHTEARIEVTATRVGNGRPRYVLNQSPMWLSGKANVARGSTTNSAGV